MAWRRNAEVIAFAVVQGGYWTGDGRVRGDTVADFVNLTILICVSLGALALGVLLAYQLLKLGFASMAPRCEMPVAKRSVETAKASA